MEQVIFGGNAEYLLDTVNPRYCTLHSGYSWATDEMRLWQLISTDGVIKQLRVELDGAPGAGKKYTFTLILNGNPTALTFDIADAATSGSDMVNEITVTGGDYVTIRCVPDNSPTARNAIGWTSVFEGDNANESLILGRSSPQLNKTTTQYGQVMTCGTQLGVTEVNYRQIIPTSGTIKDFYVKLDIDPGTPPDAYRFTVRLNGATVAQSLIVSVIANATTGSDLVHNLAVVAGDYLTMMVDPVNTPALWPYACWGMTFVADTDGESIVIGGSYQGLDRWNTRYNKPSYTEGEGWHTEVLRRLLGQVCTVKKFHMLLTAAPGAGNKWDFNLRIAGAPSNVLFTIAEAATTGDSGALEDDVALDEYVSLEAVPDDVPDAADAYWGFVCYIEPPVPSGSEDLLGKFDVGQGSADLLGKAEIQQSGSAELLGKFEAQATAELLANAEVQQSGSAELVGNAVIRHVGIPLELLGNAVIRHVGTPAELLGKAEVQQSGSAELFGKAEIQQSGSSELLSNGIIRHSDTAELLGKAIIRNVGSAELLGKADIRHSDTAELLGKAEVRQPGSVELLGRTVILNASSIELLGRAIIRHVGAPVELLGKAEVQHSGSAEFFAKLIIQQKATLDLLGEFIVRQVTYEDLLGELVTRHSFFLDLFGEFIIRHEASVDLPCEFIVRQEATINLPCEFIVRHSATMNFPGEFIVRHSTTLDLPAEFIIRHEASVDLHATFESQTSVDLLGELTVRNVGKADLLGEFIARNVGTANLSAKFQVTHWDRLFTKLWIRHPYRLWANRRYLNGIVELDETELSDALLEYVIQGVMDDIKSQLINEDLLVYDFWTDITETPKLIRRATAYGTVASLYSRDINDPNRRIVLGLRPMRIRAAEIRSAQERAMDYWESRMEKMISLYLTSGGRRLMIVDTEDEEAVFSLEDIPFCSEDPYKIKVR